MKAIRTLLVSGLMWTLAGGGIPVLANAQATQGGCLKQCVRDFIDEVSVVSEEYQACAGEFCLQNPDDPSCGRIMQVCTVLAQLGIGNASQSFEECIAFTCGVQLPEPDGNGGDDGGDGGNAGEDTEDSGGDQEVAEKAKSLNWGVSHR